MNKKDNLKQVYKEMNFKNFELCNERISEKLGKIKIYKYKKGQNEESESAIETQEWIDKYSNHLQILVVEGHFNISEKFDYAVEALRIRSNIKHQNITPLLCFKKNENSNQLFAAYQNAETSLDSKQISTFKEILKMTFQVLQALAYLQNSNSLHGDIRPNNILYFDKEDLYKLNEMFVNDKLPKEINLNHINGISLYIIISRS